MTKQIFDQTSTRVQSDPPRKTDILLVLAVIILIFDLLQSRKIRSKN